MSKKEFLISDMNSEIEEFLTLNKYDLQQKSIPEDDIADILMDLKNHINKRIGEIFIIKGMISIEDVKNILVELGEPSIEFNESKDIQFDENKSDKNHKTIKKDIAPKNDIISVPPADINANQILLPKTSLKYSLKSFLLLIWISTYLFVFINTLIIAYDLFSTNITLVDISSDSNLILILIIIVIPLTITVYTITGIYSIWNCKTTSSKIKNSFILQKLLFIAILFQIYAYLFIFYRYYLHFNYFNIFPLIISLIALISYFYTIISPPHNYDNINSLRSENL